jgi:hypothetical protein
MGEVIKAKDIIPIFQVFMAMFQARFYKYEPHCSNMGHISRFSARENFYLPPMYSVYVPTRFKIVPTAMGLL